LTAIGRGVRESEAKRSAVLQRSGNGIPAVGEAQASSGDGNDALVDNFAADVNAHQVGDFRKSVKGILVALASISNQHDQQPIEQKIGGLLR
jgi:hypothetical protein